LQEWKPYLSGTECHGIPRSYPHGYVMRLCAGLWLCPFIGVYAHAAPALKVCVRGEPYVGETQKSLQIPLNSVNRKLRKGRRNYKCGRRGLVNAAEGGVEPQPWAHSVTVWWQLAPVSSSCSCRAISFLYMRAIQTLVPVTLND